MIILFYFICILCYIPLDRFKSFVTVLDLASDGIVITFGLLVLGAAFEFYQIVQFALCD